MKKITLLIIGLLQLGMVWANGITINNVSLENFNESEGWVNIQFDIFWYNSWRIDAGPSNWDAAWVFAKYRANSGPWQHVTVSPSNNEIHPDYIIDASSDNKGVFIYRSDVSTVGVSNAFNVNLGWDLNADGIDINDTIEVKVFAIEMVYVPEGAFYVGGGGNETNQLKKGNSFNTPYLIENENEIIIGTGINNLYYDSGSYGGDQQGPIPAEFPKGYNAFYCMKYEISEQQYVEFFNTVDANFQSLVDITGSTGKNSDDEVDGNTVSWLGEGAEATTTTPDRACSFINGSTLNRYLGWAGLRPMTEFEFEKASRGPGLPSPEAYAWGNTNISTTAYPIAFPASNIEQIDVLPATNEGRAAYNLTSTNVPRPLRCGIFSGSSNDMTNGTRENAGASYYGIMELSGNLMEPVVGIGTSNSRNFTGNYQGTTVTTTLYNFGLNSHFKGGGWNSNSELLKVGDRTYSGTGISLTNFLKEMGGRGVRGVDD
jgi:formylglycine-generating enzyme required for sulfatase activity